jgi:hypothetical protein
MTDPIAANAAEMYEILKSMLDQPQRAALDWSEQAKAVTARIEYEWGKQRAAGAYHSGVLRQKVRARMQPPPDGELRSIQRATLDLVEPLILEIGELRTEVERLKTRQGPGA